MERMTACHDSSITALSSCMFQHARYEVVEQLEP